MLIPMVILAILSVVGGWVNIGKNFEKFLEPAVRTGATGYGLTEASPIITQTSSDDPIEVRVGTVGRPLPGVEVKLVHPATREPVGPDEAILSAKDAVLPPLRDLPVYFD